MRILFSIILSLFCVLPVYADLEEGEIQDPFEGYNRAVFWFNDQLDIYLLEPVASGYDSVVPNVVQDGISNFFENLRYPQYLLSDLVQLKFEQAIDHTSRFLLNTTVGLVGFIDVADKVGFKRHREDFGSALSYYGLPPGPYFVWPFFGPSNVRDSVGMIVDFVLDPLYWVGVSNKIDSDDRFVITTTAGTLRIVDTRADLLDAVEAAKESSLDYYLFVQGAYYQYRDGLVNDKQDDNMYTSAKPNAQGGGDDWFDDDPDFGVDE